MCVFSILPLAAVKETAQQLQNFIGDISWLLCVSAPVDYRDDAYIGLPPIAENELILYPLWGQIAILCSGSIEECTDAVVSLVSLACDNNPYWRLIIEKGGVCLQLKLGKVGRLEGQEHGARAIGLLGCNRLSVENIVNAGVCSLFAKILKEVQIVVALTISELAANHPKCQDHFETLILYMMTMLSHPVIILGLRRQRISAQVKKNLGEYKQKISHKI